MLTITVPETEMFDDESQKFITIPKKELRLEHSLVSISKWESKWKKPFLSNTEMTYDQTIDYIRCMTITQNVNPLTYRCLTMDSIQKVRDYIDDPMTATWFKNKPKGGNRSIITSEVLYWQMIALEIPFECQTWHLNRLLTLIHVCSEKQQTPKKMSKGAIAKNNRSLNAARRARLGTRG